MKPAWWQLYGIGVLLVGLIGLIEAVLSAGALRTTVLERRGHFRVRAHGDLAASQPDGSRLGAAPINPTSLTPGAPRALH